MNREPIFKALFARVKAVPGLKSSSRRLKHWTDTPASEQPALFQAQGNQVHQTVSGQPGKWTLFVELYLYVQTTGGEVPAEMLNPLLDAIEAVFNPDNPVSNTCTLGGLVKYARISGQIETDEGTLGDQAVAIVPVEILVTD